MSSCKIYSIVQSSCPCLLKYDDGCGNIGSINLEGAKVVSFEGGFNIFSPTGGLKVGDGSDFTAQDVDALICQCKGGEGPNGSEEEPISVSLDGNLISCSETVTEALPVRLVCDDTQQIELACDEDGNIVFVNLSTSPPEVSYPDGSLYTGNITRCDIDQQQSETCFVDDTGSNVTRIITWPVNNPLDTTIFWVLSDGTVTDIDPGGLTLCDQVCDPYIGQFFGNPKNTEPYNKINIFTPKCRTTTITTSAGIFSSFGGKEGSNFCLDWECNLEPEITITIDDSEKLEQVITTIQRTK